MSNAHQDSPRVENPAPIQAVLPDLPAAEMEATSFDPFKVFNKHGMIWLELNRKEHDAIVRGVLESFAKAYGADVIDVVAFHKNMHTSLKGQARAAAFRIYSHAAAVESGGAADVIKAAWFGGSKEEICSIVSNGFMCQNDGIQGIQLSPLHYPFPSVMSAVEDEMGMRHMLLCRVILGNTKTVQSGTEQLQFESGVDSLVDPGRYYIIRSAYMNSYILPNILVSFKFPGKLTVQDFHQSPQMKIAALLNVLSKYMHPSQMLRIRRFHSAYLANFISREQLINNIRCLAGDALLKKVIDSINSATSGNRNTSGEREADMQNI